MPLAELLKSIRESCSPGTWSRGVQLVRAEAVIGEEDDGDEIALRVATKGGLVSPQVVLFPDDIDWTCECNSREDACAHVAAAAIALKQARDAGKNMPGEDRKSATGHLAYRLRNVEGKLALARVIVTTDGDKTSEAVLNGSIAQIALGKIKGPKFIASDADLQFEKKLGTFGGGVIPKTLAKKVIDALDGAAHLTLDGKPVKAGPAVSGMAARIKKDRDGYAVSLEQDPAIDSVFDNGIIVHDGVVSAVGDHGLTPGEFDTFRRTKTFHKTDLGTLVGDWLPKLKRKLRIISEVELPSAVSSKPRIQIHTQREGDQMIAMPTIVYGEPALARVDGDRLTMLREGDIPLRNARLEAELASSLERMDLRPGNKEALDPADAIEFLQRLEDAGDVAVYGNGKRDFFDAGDLEAQLDTTEDGGFDVWFSSAGGEKKGARADAAALVAAWERGDPFAPLLEGGFGRVPTQWLAQHGHRVVALLAAREAAASGKEAPAWSGADVAALCEALEQPTPPSFERLRTLFEGFEGIPKPALPGDLTAELRGYQTEGVSWLSFLRDADLGAVLADDMGLGKTLQTLCAIQGRTLVVAPTSVLHNWKNEIEKFRPSLSASVYHGPTRVLDAEADVTLTTYALLRMDIDTLEGIEWDTVVLDEAQAIKNPDSQVARAAFRVNAKFRVALTGTPVENRLEDLWSQFHFVNRGLLGGRSDFRDRYVRPIESGNETAAGALRGRIRPFLLRRLKRDVAKELPPRTDIVLRCELGQDERGLYDTIRAATQEDVIGKLGDGSSVMAILEALLRLRQASCHSGLIPGQTEAAGQSSAKIDMLLETLDTAVGDGHKALVFSQWTGLLDLVEPQLQAAGLDFVRLDGSTRDRGAVVDTFQSDEGPPVMLISLKAGGTGLNLTAADHVFLLDPWWNPAVEDQAADRAHRIGQDKPVMVHRLVARDTVEERILALQDRKRQLAESAIGEGGAASKISRDELLELLQ